MLLFFITCFFNLFGLRGHVDSSLLSSSVCVVLSRANNNAQLEAVVVRAALQAKHLALWFGNASLSLTKNYTFLPNITDRTHNGMVLLLTPVVYFTSSCSSSVLMFNNLELLFHCRPPSIPLSLSNTPGRLTLVAISTSSQWTLPWMVS